MAKKRGPNTQLRMLLIEASWTSSTLARAVNAAGSEMGLSLTYDRTSVAHWLSGTRPRHPVPALVGEVLSRRLNRTVTAGTAGFAGDTFLSRPLDGGPLRKGDGAARLAEVATTDTHPTQRALLHRLLYRSALSDLPVWRDPAEREEGIVNSVSGLRVSQPELDTIQSAVHHFATGTERHGGGYARAALCAYLADDVVPWLRGSADERVHHVLLAESARLTFLLARKYVDSAHHGIAQRYFEVALKLANEAKDHVTWAIVCRGMSSQALILGHPRTALAYEECAITTLPSTAPASVRSFVMAQLAVSQAAVGNRSAAIAALREAERAADVNSLHAGPFGAYPLAALRYQQAQTLSRLGDPAGAIAALDSSVRHRSPDDRIGLALTHGARTSLLLSQRRVEEACVSWRGFLDARPGLRSARVVRVDRELRRQIFPYRDHSDVRALLAQIRSAGSK